MNHRALDVLLREFGDGILDPLWRIRNLYTIVDEKGRRVPFVPREEQEMVLANLHSRNLILKARQLGLTTLCCIMYLDDCLFNPNISAAVIAHKMDDASIIFQTKVRSVYHDLPEPLRRAIPLKQENATTVVFKNGSQMRVSTSTRSGTVQWLHVSEYGKICSMFPEKAREIRTGAFPSAEQGTITIESTAEGNTGDFYTKSERAERDANLGKKLSRLDYKFFFFSWIGVSKYELRQTIVPEGPQDKAYFAKTEAETKKQISRVQRNWWLAQERDLGGDMKREYPATPREAFEQAIEGSYFSDQIAAAYRQGRIGKFPYNPSLVVNTFWDLGRNDDNTIWLGQDDGGLTNFIGYYQNSGEFIGFYIDWLEKWRADRGAVFGRHYLPHDGDVKSIWLPGGSLEVMSGLKFYPTTVRRTPNKIEAINTARRAFMMVRFDEDETKQGLDLLKRYRKEWDDQREVYRNTPNHDEASHCADGFMTFSQSGHVAIPRTVDPRGVDRYRRRAVGRIPGSHLSA